MPTPTKVGGTAGAVTSGSVRYPRAARPAAVLDSRRHAHVPGHHHFV